MTRTHCTQLAPHGHWCCGGGRLQRAVERERGADVAAAVIEACAATFVERMRDRDYAAARLVLDDLRTSADDIEADLIPIAFALSAPDRERERKAAARGLLHAVVRVMAEADGAVWRSLGQGW
jgi:hypothetical protein